MRFVLLFVLLSILACSLVSAKEKSKADSPPGGNHVGRTVKPRLRAKRNLFGSSRPTVHGHIQRYSYGYPYNPYYSYIGF